MKKKLKVNESRYIALFVISLSVKKLFSIDCDNIYVFSIFTSINFARWKSVGLLHTTYIVTLLTLSSRSLGVHIWNSLSENIK